MLKVQSGEKKDTRKKQSKANQNTKSIHTAIEHELNEHRRMCHAPKMQNPTVGGRRKNKSQSGKKRRGKLATEASENTHTQHDEVNTEQHTEHTTRYSDTSFFGHLMHECYRFG